MGIKTGPNRVTKSTGKLDKRQRDNKKIPGSTPSLKMYKHKKGINHFASFKTKSNE